MKINVNNPNQVKLSEEELHDFVKFMVNETMTGHPSLLTEEWSEALYENVEEYGVWDVLSMFANSKQGETVPFKPLINPSMYHKALLEFTKSGQLLQFPSKYVYQWMGIIMRNTCILNSLTEIMGHTQANPTDDIVEFIQSSYPRLEAEMADDDRIEVNVSLEDVDKIADRYNQYVDTEDEQTAVESFNERMSYIGELLIDNSGRLRFRENATEYLLDVLGFDEWAVMPDGSTALSDYGLEPLFEICAEYKDNMSPEETLVLINRALDVTHMRGDLSSIFIEGGAKTLSSISEDIERLGLKVMNESVREMADTVKGQKWVGGVAARHAQRGNYEKAKEAEKYARSKRGLGGGKLTAAYNDGYKDEFIRQLSKKMSERNNESKMMTRKNTIKLTEQDLRNIVNEVLEDYQDKGEFTPIGTPGARITANKQQGEVNKERVLKCFNSIANKLYTEAQYMKQACNVQNQMFIQHIEDKKERLIAARAQQAYSKCIELYNTIRGMCDELMKL